MSRESRIGVVRPDKKENKSNSPRYFPPGYHQRMIMLTDQIFAARDEMRNMGESLPDHEAIKKQLLKHVPVDNPTPIIRDFAEQVFAEEIATVLKREEQVRADSYLRRLATPYFPQPPEGQWTRFTLEREGKDVVVHVPFAAEEMVEIGAGIKVRENLLSIAAARSYDRDLVTAYISAGGVFNGRSPIDLSDREAAVMGIFRSARAAEHILLTSQGKISKEGGMLESFLFLRDLPSSLRAFPES